LPATRDAQAQGKRSRGTATAEARPDTRFARVVVVGCSGSGKSMFASALAAAQRAPLVHLDALYWAPRWQPRPEAEFLRLTEEATAGPKWVVDGNYRRVRPIVWPRATAIVWLNFGFLLVFGRVLTRTLRRAWTGEVLFAGNRESLRKSFLSRDSILWWTITQFGRYRREYAALMREGATAHTAWHELRTPREAEWLLRSLGSDP
jgi:adenylate kinase family enzyme